jgi:hypothetical protein
MEASEDELGARFIKLSGSILLSVVILPETMNGFSSDLAEDFERFQFASTKVSVGDFD